MFGKRIISILLNGEIQFIYEIESVLNKSLQINLPIILLKNLKVYDLNKAEIHNYKISICSNENGVRICKNISLGYLGKVQNVNPIFKDKIVEFIIRYRLEKSFMTLEHYNSMLDVSKKEDDE